MGALVEESVSSEPSKTSRNWIVIKPQKIKITNIEYMPLKRVVNAGFPLYVSVIGFAKISHD